MKTWQIIDEYHVHGLAFTVDHCTQCFRRRLGVNSKTARRMALIKSDSALACDRQWELPSCVTLGFRATGSVLDWMVARCEGWDSYDVHSNGQLELERSVMADIAGCAALPSTDWLQGGPIIERENQP